MNPHSRRAPGSGQVLYRLWCRFVAEPQYELLRLISRDHHGGLAGRYQTQKTGTGDFRDCFGTGKSFNDAAFEIEYAPGGVDTGLCAGVARTATHPEGVTLQECGASSRTVWAIDLYDQPFESLVLGYYPLINGSDTNFSDPFALTYPFAGYPTDTPRPQLQVDYLSGYTRGSPPILIYNSVDDVQIWGADR
jgi:hypothetical protein